MHNHCAKLLYRNYNGHIKLNMDFKYYLDNCNFKKRNITLKKQKDWWWS